MKCEYCNSDHDASYAKGRFCNASCAKGFSTSINREIINLKRSVALKGKLKQGKYPQALPRLCLHCSIEFTPINSKPQRKYCSKKCSNIAINRNRSVNGGLKSAASQQRRSKNEMLFGDLCKSKFNVKFNQSVFNGWDADVILDNQKIAVLWNGPWHYKKLTAKHNLNQVQTRDKIKLQAINAAGYVAYVIKDLGSYDPQFVSQEFEKFLKWMREVDSNTPLSGL